MKGPAQPPLSKIVFDKYDKDHSGHISASEFSSMVEELGYKLSKEELQLALLKLDHNGDKQISYDEFRDFWATDKRFAHLQLTPEELKKLQQWQTFFKHYDKDGSGTVQAFEFSQMHAALVKNGIPVPADAVKTFNEIDKDGSGTVNFNEFSQYLLRLKQNQK